MDQTLLGTGGSCAAPVQTLETLVRRCWETGIARQEVIGEVCSKPEMASQVVSTSCLLVTDPCGSPPWLRGNGASLHELRTSC